MEASSTENRTLADFYRARFRAEFAPVFAAWLASRPYENPAAAASPFELPEYRAVQEDQRVDQIAEPVLGSADANAIMRLWRCSGPRRHQ